MFRVNHLVEFPPHADHVVLIPPLFEVHRVDGYDLPLQPSPRVSMATENQDNEKGTGRRVGARGRAGRTCAGRLREGRPTRSCPRNPSRS